jgi:serine/threonine-protein kinase
MKEAEAKAKLEEAGFKVEDPALKESSTDFEAGVVTKQSKKDIQVKEGSLILLTVSTGPDLPAMPGVTGKTYDEAVDMPKALGVDADTSIGQNAVNDDSEAGTVLEQNPKEGVQFDPANDRVTLKVSKGKAAFPMPNLIKKKEIEARAELQKHNLKLKDNKVTREPSYEVPEGPVFKQFPVEENDMVTEGTEVELWVSSGLPPDAKKVPFPLTVIPAEGQESTIRIEYSDARGDNREWRTQKIKAMTTFTIPLILTPGKDGQVTVYRDGEYLDSMPVPYDAQPASVSPSSESPPPPPDAVDPGAGGNGQ